MDKNKYHHGDLRNCLIEKGIELVNIEGERHFSLRKVATMCGVSNAAPYAHFKNKEELLEEMKDYVTKKFTAQLNHAIEGEDQSSPATLVKMGKSYVLFFIDNPQYYEFLFSQSCIKVDLSMRDVGAGNFPPFDMLKELHFKILARFDLSDEKMMDAVISAWATVHGLAAIATMKGVSYNQKWESKIEDIIWNTHENYGGN